MLGIHKVLGVFIWRKLWKSITNTNTWFYCWTRLAFFIFRKVCWLFLLWKLLTWYLSLCLLSLCVCAFKCDLVPAWATKRWLRILSREYPTLAFHACINKSFGKVFHRLHIASRASDLLITVFYFWSIITSLCCSLDLCFPLRWLISGVTSLSFEAVCSSKKWQASRVCGICRLSKCWEIISYQHFAYQKCKTFFVNFLL